MKKNELARKLTEIYLDKIYLTIEDFKCLNLTLKVYETCNIKQNVVDIFLGLMIVNAVSRYENFVKPFLLPFKKIDEDFYVNVFSINHFLIKNLRVFLSKEFKDWEPFIEFYYRRNCIVHEAGKINQKYIRKVSSSVKRVLDTYREGDKLASNSQYVISRSKILINFQKTLYGSVTSACNIDRKILYSILENINKKKKYNFNREFFNLSLDPNRYQKKSYVRWVFND